MLASPTSALDLPLKFLIAEAADGGTRVSYSSVGYLQARHEVNEELLQNLAVVDQLAEAFAI